jgi:hypothetical protein
LQAWQTFDARDDYGVDVASLPSLRSLARAATLAMAITSVLLVITIGVGMARRAWVLAALRSPDLTYADLDRVTTPSDPATPVLAGLTVMGAVASAGLFIAWLYRARRNLDRIDGARPRWGHGWALAGWFIPVANAVVPGLVVADVADNSAVPRSRLSWLVLAWWSAFVAASIVGLASSRPSHGILISAIYSSESDPVNQALRDQLAEFEGSVAPPLGEVVAVALWLVTAILGIALVRRVTALQATALDDP